MTTATKKIAAIFVGAGLGYIYWHYWGCSAGCTITSVWWKTSLWGAVMVYLIYDLFQDFLTTKKQSKTP